jgi:hypothetical protein
VGNSRNTHFYLYLHQIVFDKMGMLFFHFLSCDVFYDDVFYDDVFYDDVFYDDVFCVGDVFSVFFFSLYIILIIIFYAEFCDGGFCAAFFAVFCDVCDVYFLLFLTTALGHTKRAF